MIYSFDTGAFVEFGKHMPPDIAVSLWDLFHEMGKAKTLVVSEEVKDELQRQEDAVAKWVSDRPNLIVPSGEIQGIAAEIIRNHDIVDSESTKNQADPWVIALAEARDGSVVATEKRRKPGAHLVGIPDVCDAREIPYYRHLDFLRHEGIKF